MSSCHTDSYDVVIRSTDGSPITVSTIRPGGYYITLQYASVVQVSFSGTIQGPELLTATADPTPTTGNVGFFLGIYNVLGTVYSESTGSKNSYGTLSGSDCVPVSVKSAWPLCAGTYVINVYAFQEGALTALEASGELCIVITRK